MTETAMILLINRSADLAMTAIIVAGVCFVTWMIVTAVERSNK